MITGLFLIYNCSQAQNQSDLNELEDYINFRANYDRYSGVTALYKNDSLIFRTVKGMANKSWNIENTFNTKFDLASVTKMFTAVGIAILTERGKLETDEAFVKYYPDFPNESAGNITVKQLLTHISGMSDIFFEESFLKSDRNRLRELKDYDKFYQTIRIGDVPQNQIHYSNTNFLILGRLIEKITGKSYYEFIREEIFEPLEMDATNFFEKDEIITNKAEGYYIDPQASMEFGVPNDGKMRNNITLRPAIGMPAGGAFSTVEDMFKFFSGIMNGMFISEKTFNKFTTENRGGYGLGFQVYNQNEIPLIGHSGGFYGVSTMVFYLPEKNITFISLTNSDFAAQPVFDRFINILTGERIRQPITLSPSELKQFESFYKVTSGEMKGRQIEINALKDRLIFDGTLEFFPISKNSFFDIDNPGFVLEFERNDNNEITGFNRSDFRRFHQKASRIESSEIQELKPIEISTEKLKEYVVNFQFQEGGMMPGHRPSFTIENGSLLIDNMMQFLPYAKDKFFLKDDESMRLHYLRNESKELIQINVLRDKNIVGILRKNIE